jgi:hypothetical protein
VFDFKRVGIDKGARLTSTITGEVVVVHDAKRVVFRGAPASLTASATQILLEQGRKRKAVQGTRYWLYNNQRLDRISRQR